MQAVVLGVAGDVTKEQIMAVFPRHEVIVKQFVERGDVIREWADQMLT